MAKRINTSFVTTVTAVTFLSAGLMYFGPQIKNKIWRGHKPVDVQKLVELANEMVKEHRLPEAREAITNAWVVDKENKELCVKRGDILAMMTEEEGPGVMDQARASWEYALLVDPHYMPAANRLLDSYVDQMDIAPTVPTCERLRGAARRVLQINPADPRGRAYLHIGAIQEWVLGQPKTQEEITASLTALSDLLKQDGSFADVLFYVVRGQVFRSNDELNANRADVAIKLVNDSRAALDAAVKAYPKDAFVNLRAFQGYALVGDADHDSAQQAKDRASANAALEAARKEVDVNDPRYGDFQYIAAEWARRNGRADEAEKILRDLYARRETDQSARLALARNLGLSGDPAKRDEAIKLLEQPITLTYRGGVKALSIRELESQTLVDLDSMRISQYSSLDPAQQPAMLRKIENDYLKVKGMAVADSIPILRLGGLIHQLKGEHIECVDELSKAMTLIEHSDPKNPIKYDLMYQLATAERDADQDHAAEKLLVTLVEQFSAFIPAREQLASIYLRENNLLEAAHHIQVLAALAPNNPEVLRLRLSLAQRQGHTDELKALYAQMPETRFEDRLFKAETAAGLEDFNEDVRLLTLMSKQRPNDSRLAIALAQAYGRLNQRAKGKAVLADAIKRLPNDPLLPAYSRQYDNPTSEDGSPVGDLLADNDPYFREIKAGRESLEKFDLAAAIKHAKAAETIRHDDSQCWELYLNVYLQQKNWDSAGATIDVLSRMNADHCNGRYYRWKMAMARRQYLDAINIARDLTIDRDSFGQSWMLLAKAYKANGQYNEALEQYKAALERQTINLDAYTGMAECYVNLSQPDRAREAIESGRQIFPDNVQLRELALNYDAQQDPVSVIPKRQELLDRHPDDPEAYTALASVCFMSAAKIYPLDPVQAKAYNDQALDVLTKGVGHFPDNLRLNAQLADALRSANRAEDGVKVLDELAARKSMQGKTDALLTKAEYLMHCGQPDRAAQAATAAWDLTGRKDINIELQLSSQFERRGKIDDALKVLEANPDDLRVVSQRLHLHIAANHTEEAKKGLAEALAENPDNPDLLNLLAVVYIDGYRYPEARETCAKVLRLDPRNDQATYYQALTELSDPVDGDLPLAMHNLALVCTRNPRNIQYKIQYANALIRVKNLDQATVELEDALRIDKLNREVRVKLLNVYSMTKKWAQFESVVQDAELNPAMSEAMWARAHAYALAAQEKYGQAITKMQEARAMAVNNPMYERDYLIVLLQAHDFDGVIKESDALIDKGRKEWWIFHCRGIARAGLQDHPRALEQFDKAIEAADAAKDEDAFSQVLASITEMNVNDALVRATRHINHDDHSRLLCVSVRMRKEDWSGALADLQPLLARRSSLSRSDRFTTIRFAAESLDSMGRPQEALPYYLEWLKEAPNDTPVLNNLAYLLADRLHDPEQAVQYSRKAYDLGRKLNIEDPMVVDTHGWVMTLRGGLSANDGLNILTTLVETHPDFVDARYHLAMALLKQSRPADASGQLKIAQDQIKTLEAKKTLVSSKLKSDIQAALDSMKQVSKVN